MRKADVGCVPVPGVGGAERDPAIDLCLQCPLRTIIAAHYSEDRNTAGELTVIAAVAQFLCQLAALVGPSKTQLPARLVQLAVSRWVMLPRH